MLKFALKEKSLRNLLFLSFVFTVAIPIIIVFFINPQYQKIIIQNVELDAVQLASHLISSVVNNKTPLKKTLFGEKESKEVEEIKNHFDLYKIKIFSKAGEIVFSTALDEVGVINKKDYFKNIVAKGNVFTKVVKKDQKSMEDKVIKLDVVECYVPIMVSGQFFGAFEIYFDITPRLKRINNLFYKILFSVLFLVLVFIGSLFLVLRNSGKNIQLKQYAEQEKEKLIKELQTALGKIKTLNGMIPICSHCKKIRDDRGYWNRIESYINVGSDSDLSHSICPDCAKIYYKDINPYKD